MRKDIRRSLRLMPKTDVLKKLVVLARGIRQIRQTMAQPRPTLKSIPTHQVMPTLAPSARKRAAHKPGQILVTKAGKRYIVGTDLKYVPLTSKKHAHRKDRATSSHLRKGSAQAPQAGSLQLIGGQTFVVGEDRKTFIPITKSAASGQGVLTTFLEVVVILALADLVVDLIVDDVITDDMVNTDASFSDAGDISYGTNEWFNAGDFL